MPIDIRALDLADMDAAARVHRSAFDHRLPWLSGLHTPEEDQAYFRDQVFKACEVWGGFDQAVLLGFIAFRDGWVDQLYVSPGYQALGVGSRLLKVAKERGGVLRLWTFQKNEPARRFYEAQGFVSIEMTNGAANEEEEPDMLYIWRRPEVDQ